MLLSLIVAALILSVSSSIPVHAASTDKICMADTYTDLNNPTYNFGSLDHAYSSKSSENGVDGITYLKFDISSLSASDTVTNATLHVYCNYTNGSSANTYNESVDWNETSLNWNNQPDLGTLQDTQNTPSNSWINFTVLDAVQSSVAASNSHIAFALTTNGATTLWHMWQTKENVTYTPYLHIEYTPNPSPSPTSSSPPYSGNWTSSGSSADWTYLSATKQSFSGSNSTITYATFTPEGATGFMMNMNHTWGNLTMTPGWMGDGQVDFVLLGEMTGSNGQKVYGMVNFRDGSGWFGYDANCKVYFGNSQQWHHTIVKLPFADGSLPQYQIGMYFKQSGITLTVSYYIHGYITPNEGLNFGTGQNYDVSSWVWNETVTVPEDFGNSTQLKVYVGWKGTGQGSFEESYDLSQSIYDTVLPSGTYDTTTGADQNRSNLFSDIWNFLTGGFAFILGMVAIFTGIMLKLTPYLPYLALFYLLDVAAESIHQGSFQPIGAAFRWTVDIFLKAYDTVIHLGQLVWDAITFWT
jgi:hypothetical protein